MTARAVALPSFRNVDHAHTEESHLIHAALLLAGGGALNAFETDTTRSVLEFPVEQGADLRSIWLTQLNQLACAPPPPVRLVGGVDMRSNGVGGIERIADPQEPRGTGGILRDIAKQYPDHSQVLVAGAATLPLEPLHALIAELAATRADVAFFVDDDGVSPTLMLVRCGCLRSIAEKGFVDFKEQALPKIASANSVTVIRKNIRIAGSLRSAPDYIRSLRAYHQRKAGDIPVGMVHGAFSEDWRPTFSIVERGATVGSGARMHDSVVLSGARVGKNAVVVRSVVCPGAVVPNGAHVIDQLVRSRSAKAATKTMAGK